MRAIVSHRIASNYTVMEEAANGTWYVKQNEDGVFVKLNDERIKNKKENLMEEVLEVKESTTKGRDNHHVIVSVSFFEFLKSNQFRPLVNRLAHSHLNMPSQKIIVYKIFASDPQFLAEV